ncbi:replication initiation protein [Aureibacter tunicatorum]|uniref:Plasmid replication initiation protein n=1 Tax=Aureibacter tunicatorum TaxID=866807 RepID=A0AAE3XU03_9BACT|nr:replication initiation protein [Aureibacter tunicatorum]MDR6241934.1 plasmid replication initiation protein [Aureibacter tunicatorum]BDD07541.1 hypothetical protein AUTU_50240 [Aureibacter tunicatorum]
MDYKIVKSNKLVNAKEGFSLIQQRAILLAFSLIKPGDKQLREMSIDIHDILGLDHNAPIGGSQLRSVKEQIKPLTNTSISLKDELDEWESINFIAVAKKQRGQNKVTIKFSAEISPYLLDLKANYTQYLLSNVYKFKSKYSIRLYELCKQYEKIGKRELDLLFLKELLNIENIKTYNVYSQMKRTVITPAVHEINEFSDLDVSFIEQREGKKVVSIKFQISSKRKPISLDSISILNSQDLIGEEANTIDQHADALIASRTDIKNPEAYKAKLINSENFKKDFERQQEEKESKIRQQALKQKEKEEEKLAKEKSELYNKYYLEVRKKYIQEFPDSFKAKYVEWVNENGNAEEKKSLQELIEKRDKAPQRCWNMYGTFLIKHFGTEEDQKWLDIEIWWSENQPSTPQQQSIF